MADLISVEGGGRMMAFFLGFIAGLGVGVILAALAAAQNRK